MGLLDSILGAALGQTPGQGQMQGAGGGNPAIGVLMQLAMQLMAGNSSGGGGGGGGGAGGLGSLIDQFQRAGLGQQMNSWIGTGQNMPISPDQLTQALGHGRLQEMAAASGMDVGQVSSGLSELLPQLIDHVTPQGHVPAQGIDGALSDLARMLPR